MNLRGIVLGIAIFVLTLFVATYGVNTFYSEPQYDDFCSNSYLEVSEWNESICFEEGGKWISYSEAIDGKPSGWCDRDYMCREAYELSRERYYMNVFLIAVPLGILILIFGLYFFSLEYVGVGLMLGGVGTMLRGISSYWRYSEDWLRFLISLIGLIVVIWFSYKFSDKISNNTKDRRKKK